MAKVVPQNCNELYGSSLFAHFDYIRPVSLAVNEDKEVFATMGCKISSYFLKGSLWYLSAYHGLLAVGGQVILTVMTSTDKQFDILVNSWPIDSQTGASDPLVSFMKAAEHCCTKTCRDQQSASIHYQVVINA